MKPKKISFVFSVLMLALVSFGVCNNAAEEEEKRNQDLGILLLIAAANNNGSSNRCTTDVSGCSSSFPYSCDGASNCYASKSACIDGGECK